MYSPSSANLRNQTKIRISPNSNSFSGNSSRATYSSHETRRNFAKGFVKISNR